MIKEAIAQLVKREDLTSEVMEQVENFDENN